MLLLILLFLHDPAPVRFSLTVLGGSGSGAYACGSTVKIVGDRTRGSEVFGQWFAGWDGDTAVTRLYARKAKVTMPCHDATVEARFMPKPPKFAKGSR